MFPAILTVGKVVLMGLGGLTIVGSVASLAQRRGGRDIVDLDDYQWANDDGEMVDWDELGAYKQVEYLDDVTSGNVKL